MVKSLCMRMGVSLGLAYCMLSCLLYGARAQSNCNTELVTLQPCLAYMVDGNSTMPGADCCKPLGSLITSDPTCLCQLGPLAQQLGFTINQTRAIEIATSCNQIVPSSVTSCLSTAGIAPSPSVPITAGGPSTPTSNTPTPPGGTNKDTNYGNVLSVPSLLLGSIFVALSLHFGILT